jgi:NADH:ubiquinone oxidoreductase subunit 6 (subunit J)
MEEKKVMTHIVKGLLVSLILIVLGIAGYLTGLYKEGWFSWTTYVIELIGIIIGCVSYANQMNGLVTFGNVFAHGFKMSVVIALILIVWFLLAITVIFPEMKERIFDMTRQRMEDNGKMSESQIDQAMDMTRKFFIPFAIAGTLLGTLICGAIASLIGAGIAKKKPINPLDQMSV